MTMNQEKEIEPLTWSETKALMRADYERLEEIFAQHGRDCQRLKRSPSYIAVYLYRVAHYLYRNHRRMQARLVWHLNQLITGADISEPAEIGPGFVVLHPVGVSVMCKAGKNLTIGACAGIGGEIGKYDDVGAGPGLALLGDNVSLGVHGGIMGPVVIGDNVQIGACVGLIRDIPADSVVEISRIRVIRR